MFLSVRIYYTSTYIIQQVQETFQVYSLDWTHDKNRIVSASQDGRLIVWNALTISGAYIQGICLYHSVFIMYLPSSLEYLVSLLSIVNLYI
ncbi:putative transcription factor WD40-like family [Helianthus anomalus]